MKPRRRRIAAMVASLAAALVMSLSCVTTASASSVYLSVPIYVQEQSYWCWAATSKSVSVYLGGSNSSQCQYVKWGKNSSSCANVTGDLSTDVRRALSSAGIRNTGSMINSAASTATISGQINNSKPLMVRWGWDSGGGHMLVIRGYTSDPGYLVVSYIDPLQSYYSSGTYDWMKSGSGHTWTHTRYGFSR